MIARRTQWLGPSLTLVALLLQVCWVQGDADFESVRVHPEYKYMGGRGGDPKEKYSRKVYCPIMPATSLILCRRVGVSASQCLFEGRISNKYQSFHPHYDGRYAVVLCSSGAYKC